MRKIIVLAALLFSSTNINVRNVDLHTTTEFDKLHKIIAEQEEKICSLEEENSDTDLLLERLYEQKKAKYFKIGHRVEGTLFSYKKPYQKDLVHYDLMNALLTYSGPPSSINSIHRPQNTKSLHSKGRAVDLEPTKKLIEYLVSTEGTKWRIENNIQFFIEDNTWSSTLKRYKENKKTSPFVFMNTKASGLHVHLGIQYNTI